jgi:hypothetical protein
MSYPEAKYKEEIAAIFLRFQGVRLVFTGTVPTDPDGEVPQWVSSVITELTNNSPIIRECHDRMEQVCAGLPTTNEQIAAMEKVVAELRERAPRIEILAGRNFIVVKDDVSQPDPQATLAAIRRAVTSEHGGMSTKSYGGGAGLWSIMQDLEPRHGRLRHRLTDDNRIVAIATWRPGTSNL